MVPCLLLDEKREGKPSRRNRNAIDWKKVVATLEAELSIETPLPLSAVADKVGVAADTLRNREPKLCSEISSRWQAWQKAWNNQRKLDYAVQVRMDAMRLANQGHRPTWQGLLDKGLPAIPIWHLQTFVQNICNEVWDQVEASQQIA